MATNHVRSTSLPTATHPLIASAVEQLQRLKSSELTSTSSHSTIFQRLDGLRKLYECVDDVLLLPINQQVLSLEKHAKLLEQVSDVSLNVVDTCSIVKDAFSQIKERKYFRDLLNHTEKNYTIVIDDSDLASSISLIKGVEEVSLTVLESTLSFISNPKMRSKASGLSLFSKLLKPKRVSCEGADISEVEKIDMELLLLIQSKQTDHSQMQSVLKKLETFESNIQELEDGLGTIFRYLLKTRVSLLNLLNH
uniref:Uncharacterized protein n=2 Tax=Nicotiana TaxID=4085 RepID=A0A1S4CRM4_TOBAC|nr:PREDICTED: uncharacterized protein LOC107821733 [Nicotiana tabacum]